MNTSRALAQFVLGYRRADDRRARDAATAAVVDGLASVIGGPAEEFGQVLHAYARAHKDSGGAVVAGSRMRLSPGMAAYINAAAGHSLCYDDTSNAMMGHPTIVVLPAALAVGESAGATGAEVLDAYTVGVEVAVRVSAALAPGHYQRGWHATGTAGVIGAAAAAARLLHLDESATAHALGIAASSAAGLRANFGTMAMIYHAGLAARGGVDAALLAREGMTSAPDPFSGPMGYFAMFRGEGAEAPSPACVIERLANPLELVEPGLDVKPYPCGSLSHRCIQAALQLRREVGFDASDVIAVECRLPDLHREVLVHQHPTRVLDARISLVYPVAIALRNGSCQVADFSLDNLADPEVQRLMGCIRLAPLEVASPRSGVDLFAAPAEVTVQLRNGAREQRRVTAVKGSPANPLTPAETRAKFDECAWRVLGQAEADRLWDLAWRIDELSDVGALTVALVPGGAG